MIMPPTIRWKCSQCGNERIMSADVTLVLCQCNYKNMIRVGNINSAGKHVDKAAQDILE